MELPPPDPSKKTPGKKPIGKSGRNPFEIILPPKLALPAPEQLPLRMPVGQKIELPDDAPSLIEGLTREEARRILAAHIARQRETMRIWKPNPIQEAFHRCLANIRLLLGGNRSGKSLSAILELVRAVTGTDPHNKYPKRNGIAIIVGKDETSLADVIWERLYKPGAFKIIRDLEAERQDGNLFDKWRAVLPNDPLDLAREGEWRDAEPFLPHRLCGPNDIVWGAFGRGVPAVVRIPSTGWEIRFFTGGSKPRAGFVADLVWMDEELENELWPREMRARLVDRKGCMIWSATPENCSQAMYALYERHLAGDKNVEAFHLISTDNKYISQVELEKLTCDMDAETYSVKVEGKFKLGGQIIFPEFSKKRHVCEPFEIPHDWSRFASFDPGHQPASAGLFAIAPDSDPKYAGRVYMYDEIVVNQSSASKLADAFKNKTMGHSFEAWLIDYHFARQHQSGTGTTIESQYENAFRELGLETNQWGISFCRAAEGHKNRNSATKTWLEGDKSKLQIFSTCQVAISQMEKYHYRRDKKTGLVGNDPVKKNDHMPDIIGGMAAFDPQFRKKSRGKGAGPVARALAQKAKRQKSGDGISLGGPNSRSPGKQ